MPKVDLRAWVQTAVEGTQTLMGRPLTSFHLVVGLTAVLTVLGLIMVWSASAVEGYAEKQSAYGAFGTQAVFAVLGWAGFYLILRVQIRFYRRFATFGIVASLVLLALVLVPSLGVEVDGARRWFQIAGVSIQPSDIAKVALCVWGAHVLAGRRTTGAWVRELMIPLVPVVILMAFLIIAEPNLSTTVIILVITAALLWFAGLPGSVFAAFVGLFSVAGVIAAFSADYRAARVFSFLGSADPLDGGYQAMQAKFALANGGVFGVGLGQSTAKWSYLPNAHNDFIFAILVEETGLIGGMTVVVLFLMLGYVGMRIARRSADPFLRLLTGTITVLITTQMFINVGYVVGLLPVTGIQLPLLSQGGTSMLTMLLMLGMLASAARHEPEAVIALSGKRGSPEGLARWLHLPPPAAFRPRVTDPARDRSDRRRSAGRMPDSRRDRRRAPGSGAPPSGAPGQARNRPAAPRGATGRTAVVRGVRRPPPSSSARPRGIEPGGETRLHADVPGSTGASRRGGDRRASGASPRRPDRAVTQRSDEIHYPAGRRGGRVPPESRRSAARDTEPREPRRARTTRSPIPPRNDPQPGMEYRRR
ncbi:MAG: putative lipid II flippase FtsW [Gordonia sp. (in: high G+C Gram-positive bacteria)]|uniref:putative lipid II flippase FtsW n=1 Tax=Gordonia sp. (in: high G+C Gram-positive bacteria) TaxID=84139 RepID=UPI0039E3EBD9